LAALHPAPVQFSSPLSQGVAVYDRVAFESDLAAVEAAVGSRPCNRLSGANCVNPPPQARFYPFYSTNTAGGACVWQLGGGHIPGTANAYGGSPAVLMTVWRPCPWRCRAAACGCSRTSATSSATTVRRENSDAGIRIRRLDRDPPTRTGSVSGDDAGRRECWRARVRPGTTPWEVSAVRW
jgi:hypothetical protein